MKNLVILGSSGSIGKSALWVAERFPEELNIFGLAVHSNIQELSDQIARYRPQFACVADEQVAREFEPEAKRLGVNLFVGESGLEQLASLSDAHVVLNAVVGFAGLRSTLAAARSGKKIALANKESMVAGGELVKKTARHGGAEIIPVDSEHSAIFQCLKSGRTADVQGLFLTSSGGPFRNLPIEKFPDISVEQALRHPTWNMGRKITIDSATLMNKGFEIIEAVYLFDITAEKIKVVVHPQSIIHSMVEYIDGSIIAQMSKPDMRLPVQYALFYPERRELGIANLEFEKALSLDFEPPDESKFPSLSLARLAFEKGGGAPAVLNAANEIAVESFLKRKIKFTDIFAAVDYAIHNCRVEGLDSIDSILAADNQGRELARNFVTGKSV